MHFVQGDDRPLDCHWTADTSVLERIGLGGSTRPSQAKARASIVAAAVLERQGQDRRISYSRSRDWYGERDRYTGLPLTRDLVCNFIDEMADRGLVHNTVAPPNSHKHPDPTKRLQSAFRASDDLMSLIGDTPLKHRGPRAHVIMRDEFDDLWDLLPSTEQARRAIADIEAVNKGMRPIKIDVDPAADPANWCRSGYHLRARKVAKDGTETWSVVTPTDPEVVRIFGRGRMDCHGRIYGFWQNLPKERRKELRINGEIIVEPDFACLHPTLLYAMKGIRLDYDPYDTGSFPRDHGKLALNIGINCKKGLKGAVDTLMFKDGWKESRSYTKRLVDDIAARNEPIKEFIGSDAGVRLMGIDSRMALDVLKRCHKDGVAVLPVHDSFGTGRSNEGIVTAHMEQVLEETRVRLSGTSSMGSGQIRRQTPRGGRGAPSSPLPAEPVESPRAEPVETLPPEAAPSLAEPRGCLPAEPLVPSVAEPTCYPAPRGSENLPPSRVAPTRGPSTPGARPGSLPGTRDPILVPEPGPVSRPALAVPETLTLHIPPEVLLVTHAPRPAFPASPHWTIWRPDGTCHKGHRMFLEAEALIAAGHDPFKPVGNVAPGLGNASRGVVGTDPSAYTVGTPRSGTSCTTA